jgi:hypothetical protein
MQALGLAELAKARRAVQVRTNSGVGPGAQLHVGVGDYNEEHAKQLRLKFAAADASPRCSTPRAASTPRSTRKSSATRTPTRAGIDLVQECLAYTELVEARPWLPLALASGRDGCLVPASGRGLDQVHHHR